jgi:hypothetical protein
MVFRNYCRNANRNIYKFVHEGVASTLAKRRKLPLLFYAVAFVLALPVIIPYAMLCDYARRRKLRRLCKTFRCTNCNEILGIDSLDRSDAYWQEYGRRMRRAYPGARLRMVRTNWAICGNCGAAYTLDDRTCEFETTERKPLPPDHVNDTNDK